MASRLADVTGGRGEKIVGLRLTDYPSSAPLFRAAFLGDKWPVVDLYVELDGVMGCRPYFFVQVKATRAEMAGRSSVLNLPITREAANRLLQTPGPTYLFGVHEPTRRIFARAVHTGIDLAGVGRMDLRHELTDANLDKLYAEVRDFWTSGDQKPATSVFA